MAFAPAPEYQVFPSGPEPLDFYEAVVHATRDTLPLVRELQPDVVVADILTLAPALAAEIERAPWRHADPPRLPARRARLPDLLARRAPAAHGAPGALFWRARAAPGRPRPRARPPSSSTTPARALGLPRARARPRRHQPRARARRHLPAARVPPRLARARARRRPAHVGAARRATSSSAALGRCSRSCSSLPPPRRTPSTGCCAPRCAGSARRAGARARHLEPAAAAAAAAGARRTRASSTGSPTRGPCRCCDVVVCHAGHGTLVRALACGCAVVACPAVGDMNENAARLDWAGAGVRLPRRFVSPRPLRLAVERALGRAVDPGAGARARCVG